MELKIIEVKEDAINRVSRTHIKIDCDNGESWYVPYSEEPHIGKESINELNIEDKRLYHIDIGDVKRVKKWEDVKTVDGFYVDMKPFCNKKVTIISKIEADLYEIEEDDGVYAWSHDMFIPSKYVIHKMVD